MPYVSTGRFDASSPASDRSVTFGNYSDLLFNQYSVQVFDGDGNAVDTVSSGTVSVQVGYGETTKMQATETDLILNSDPWVFEPFLMHVNRAVFSVTGLPDGFTVRARCFRGDHA